MFLLINQKQYNISHIPNNLCIYTQFGTITQEHISLTLCKCALLICFEVNKTIKEYTGLKFIINWKN